MATNNSTNTGKPVTVAQGGTGGSSLTAYAVVCGGTTATSPLQPIAGLGTAGHVLTSNGAGALPTMQPLPSGGSWVEVVGTSQAMSVNTNYIANNAALVTLTLPATAALGDTIKILGKGAGGWLVAQNASQFIHVGSSVTTTGVGGSAASTDAYDCITITCTTVDDGFIAYALQGNITVV